MYVIPLVVLLLLGLVAVAWNPIFALVAFAIFFVAFLVYAGFSRETSGNRAAERRQPGAPESHTDDSDTGLWGERRPS